MNYSLEEQQIGTWIDGKPLYQKTFMGKIPSDAGNGYLVELGADAKGVYVEGYVNYSGGTLPINTSYNSNLETVLFLDGWGSWKMSGYYDDTSSFVVTYRYTKLTD